MVVLHRASPTPTGKRYGYQLTFFRHRVDSNGLALNPSKWFADNVYMAHMAITDETAKRFVYGEKLNRAALGLAAPRSSAITCGMRTGWPNGSARCSTWSERFLGISST